MAGADVRFDPELTAEMRRVGVRTDELMRLAADAGLRGNLGALVVLYRRRALRALRSLPDGAGSVAFIDRLLGR